MRIHLNLSQAFKTVETAVETHKIFKQKKVDAH